MKKILLLCLMLVTPIIASADAAPPPADVAFPVGVKVVDPNSFVLEWQTKPGFFLYRDRIKVASVNDSNFSLGDIRFPKARKHTDQQGKMFRVYRDNLAIPVAVLGDKPGEGFLNLSYQGCADDGFCYPPESRQIKITINKQLELVHASIEPMPVSAPMDKVLAEGGDQLDNLFAAKNWGVIFLSFLGFGILLTFTPCVLPMIPVLSGIIVGQGKNISTKKSFFLSLSYVLSMAFTYATFGAVVALAGSNLQIAMQTPFAIGAFSLIFVLLALSMFGFYELRIPASWQARLTSISHKQATGHYVGAAIMGALATLILSPCVTAPLIGALSYIASSGDVLRGAIALFFLGLGMGIPLLIIGTSAGKLLPKAGTWMNVVKSFFGVLLLAVAIYLLARILPSVITMLLWGSLLVFCGIYAGAFDKASSYLHKFNKGLGIILLAYGLLIVVGASKGNVNPLLPLEPSQNYLRVDTGLPTKKLSTLAEVEQEMHDAHGMPVIIDFYADWCSSCQHIEATTLKDPEVIAQLRDFVFIKVDVTKNNADSKALLNRFDVVAPPTFIFYNKEGDELNNLRLVGEVSSKELLTEMNKALK